LIFAAAPTQPPFFARFLVFRSSLFHRRVSFVTNYKASTAKSQAALPRDDVFSPFFPNFCRRRNAEPPQAVLPISPLPPFIAKRPSYGRFNPQFQNKKFRQNSKFPQNGLGAAKEIEYTVY